MRNVWNRDPYRWYKYKKDWKAIVGQFRLDLRCCRQRITKGYCEKDLWSIRDWFLDVVSDMLEEYKKCRYASPGILGETYQNEEGFLVNDTCHDEQNRILDEMTFLFREADERQCRRKNPYKEEHSKAFSLFMDKYGLLGEKLRTPEELEHDRLRNVITSHNLKELPEYKELCAKYDEEKKKLEQYREECKNKAFDLFSKWFYSLWDQRMAEQIGGGDTMTVYITGDTHGDFRQIGDFCSVMGTKRDDVMIVLGDAGLNYFGDERDTARKIAVSRTRMTYLMVQGNHEMRPAAVDRYKLVHWNGGMVYQEGRFPNLLFAKDGEIYRLGGKDVLVIGGAYSVDKEYRLRMRYRWFADEQPSDEIKEHVEQQLDRVGWKVDAVLSHTCPRKYEPVEHFMPGIDQSKVDKSTENWLDTIEDRLDYKEWYCGHWHINKRIDKLTFLFHNIRLFN